MAYDKEYGDVTVDFGSVFDSYDGEVTNDSFNATALTLTLTLETAGITPQSTYVSSVEAITLTLYGPTVRIDSNYTDTAQALALTLEDPAYRSDGNYTDTVQALTAVLNDPTYRSDVNWTSTALELVLALGTPVPVWSSSFSATALALAGTLVAPSTDLKTNIIRKSYTFGTTEQVTFTKINNFVDTAVWEISNQAAGDMFYYEGTAPDYWKRIAKGTAGQVLTIAGGIPTWA